MKDKPKLVAYQMEMFPLDTPLSAQPVVNKKKKKDEVSKAKGSGA